MTNHLKAFTTLDNIGHITIKKIDDCENINSVNPLYLLIDHRVDILKKMVSINIWFLTLQIKIKSYSKNIMVFGMELEIRSKK